MSPSKKNVLAKLSSAVENPGRFFRNKFGRKKVDKGKQVCRDSMPPSWGVEVLGEDLEEHQPVALKRGPSKRVQFVETPVEIPTASMAATECSDTEISKLEGMSKDPVVPTEAVEQEGGVGEPKPEPAAGKFQEPQPEPQAKSTPEVTLEDTMQQEPAPKPEAKCTTESALEDTTQQSEAKIEVPGEKEMELQLQAKCQALLLTSADTEEELGVNDMVPSVQVTGFHVQQYWGLSDIWENMRQEMAMEDPTVFMPCAYPSWLRRIIY